jgi:hypothetical protein
MVSFLSAHFNKRLIFELTEETGEAVEVIGNHRKRELNGENRFFKIKVLSDTI